MLAQEHLHQFEPTVLFGEALSDVYRDMLKEEGTPNEIVEVPAGEIADVTISLDRRDTSIKRFTYETITQLYIDQTIKKAVRDSWWNKLSDTLQKTYDMPDNKVKVLSKRRLGISNNGEEAVGQDCILYEVGEKAINDGDRNTIFEGLTFMDQLSGGLLSALNLKVIAGTGLELHHPDTIGETEGGYSPGVVGYQQENIIFLNMKGIDEKADLYGLPREEVLSAAIFHEIGHIFDDGNRWFSEYFEYSNEHEDGEFFKDIYKHVSPKDKTVSSQPVNEYGRVSIGEDYATSFESLLGEVLQWKVNDGEGNYSVHTKHSDSYRHEIVLRSLQALARRAGMNGIEGASGNIASEIKYVHTKDGGLEVVPRRTYSVKRIEGDFIEAEMNETIGHYSARENDVIRYSVTVRSRGNGI